MRWRRTPEREPGPLGYVKRPPGEGAARAEAAGLRWLREASPAVVEVHSVGDAELRIEMVRRVAPTPQAARHAGCELARIHDAGAPAFGSPPPGWDGPNYIGRVRQACRPAENWGGFYVEQRVLPFARKALDARHIISSDFKQVERLCQVIRARDWDDEEPARIHGDLWSGNLLFGEEGPRFIDPAAHGGHRLTDLAMLDLFGAPHLPEIFASYESVHPLPAGWRDLIPLHQLHPLAVHAWTHGRTYGYELMHCVERVWELLDR